MIRIPSFWANGRMDEEAEVGGVSGLELVDAAWIPGRIVSRE